LIDRICIAQKVFPTAPKERGQARLPDPELFKVSAMIGPAKFPLENIRALQKSQGREGGLAPALFCTPTLLPN
jgi:hypothetical protein